MIKFNILPLFFSAFMFSQVGIGLANPNPSAALELSSSNKGLVLPHIALTSKTDVITIPSPAAGLVVYNTINSSSSVPEPNKVYADLPYVFDGTQWQEIMDDEKINTFITLPKVYAKGRKTTMNTSCTNLNYDSFALDVKDPNIGTDGTIVASQSGFYKFTISIGMTFLPNQFIPILYYTPGTQTDDIRFSFTFRGNAGYLNRNISYSALIYLNAGDTSGHFQWLLGGNNKCTVDNKINQQEVVWQYLGNL